MRETAFERLQKMLTFQLPRNRAERRQMRHRLQLPTDYHKANAIKWQRAHPQTHGDTDA